MNKTIKKHETGPTAGNAAGNPAEGASLQQADAAPGKKPYRKPKLVRLGELKSVAGSGIIW